MAKLDDNQKRRGLKFAAELTALAGRAPDLFSEQALHQLAQKLNVHYGYSREYKKAAIIKFTSSEDMAGSASVNEIREKFRWHKDEIYGMVRELCIEGRLEEFIIPPKPQGGRPLKRYRPCSR
ncbi:MAG: hypothetical protein JO053_13145 [Acidobacteria bacterium]|nr:hypothetical protein [Acidobacteriota bacterium]